MRTKQKHRTCTECGQRIPMERLRTLPDTWTCVRCSNERPKRAEDIEIDGAAREEQIGSAQAPQFG